MDLPRSQSDAITKARESENVGYQFACYTMALTINPDLAVDLHIGHRISIASAPFVPLLHLTW